MKIENNEAFTEMLQLFLNFEGHPASNQVDVLRSVETYVSRLCASGWTRKDIYQVIYSLITEDNARPMPEDCSDALDNYMSRIVGDVAVGYMVRLPGEPSDIDEHARYVREKRWLREPQS